MRIFEYLKENADNSNRRIEEDRLTTRIVYILCFAQFLIVYLIVALFCKPINKIGIAVIGCSAVFGVYASGAARRYFKKNKRKGKEVKKKEESLFKRVFGDIDIDDWI